MNNLLLALITEGESILKEASDAHERQGTTATVHIREVVDWHRRAASFVIGASPNLATQVPHFAPYDEFDTILVAISGTLNILRSLTPAPLAVSSDGTLPLLSASPSGHTPAKAKTLSELFIEVFVPKNRFLRFLLASVIGIVAVCALAWSGLPDDTKKEILRPVEKYLGIGQEPPNTGLNRTDTALSRSPAG